MHRNRERLFASASIFCGFLLFGCQSQTSTQPGSANTTASPTPPPAAASSHITSKKSGKTFSYVHVAESDEEFEKFELPKDVRAASNPDMLYGTDRKAAKTSVSTAPAQTFADLAALFNSGLFIADSKMTNHHPPIQKTAASNRVKEEQHNVVVNAYLYASSKESDNDFHCIMGTAPGEPMQFLNVEVSGLPASGPFLAPLKMARDKFKEFFGQDLPGQGYNKFDPPIPVRISGSIFFDVDHPAGAVGPTGLKPATAWEIHPVTDIEFEP